MEETKNRIKIEKGYMEKVELKIRDLNQQLKELG